MYFEKFPTVTYSLDGGVTAFSITDLFVRIKADVQRVLTRSSYDEYDVIDGETPEILADKFYNNSNLYWVILIANEILDPRYDWPLTSEQLKAYTTDKYGSGNETAIHHYVTNDVYEDIVHSSYAGSKFPVTNADYEEEQNQNKRRIKVLKPQFISEFVTTFTGLLNGQ